MGWAPEAAFTVLRLLLMREMWRTPSGRIYLGALMAVAITTVAGVFVFWPHGESNVSTSLRSASTERAEIIALRATPCPTGIEGGCEEVEIRLQSGPDKGQIATIQSLGGPGTPAEAGLETGQVIRVSSSLDSRGSPTYLITDFERRGSLLWLALLFTALVVAFGRWRGALSLLGLGVGLAIVLAFIVPAILDGSPPLWVAIFGSLAAMIVTILLAHGAGAKSVAAILGTAGSLVLVALLASLAVGLTNITGFSSEESTSLAQNGVLNLESLSGLVLAGMVIGALGVLDDVTVSQASTVVALRKANPSLRFRGLYSRAVEVGRDHVSATVNTLVFAYVGASLPILLILTSTDLGLIDGINLELVAKEVVAMLVGSIGLIVAVPLTTAIAAALVAKLDPSDLGATSGHHH